MQYQYIYRITPRRIEVLGVIARHVAVTGRAPSRRELCRLVGVASKNTVSEHVEALVELGLLVREPTMPWGLTLTDKARTLIAAESELTERAA